MMVTAPAGAATMSLADIAVGQIISLNGMRFAKIGVDPVNGSQFTAICESNCSSIPHCTACSTITLNECRECAFGYMLKGGTCVSAKMQDWDSCDELATPTGINFTQGPILVDARDGKSYEIRKFADGKCWMADNLMYGGGTDGSSDYCAGKATWRNATSAANASATATNGLNPPNGSRNTLVGDCRDSTVGTCGQGDCNYCVTGAGKGRCGYLYNWSATLQNANGWSGNSYQPTEPVQGICPTGWHVPSGSGNANEFQTLHAAAGSPGINFWVAGSFKAVYMGYVHDSLGVLHQGTNGYYQQSGQVSVYSGGLMCFLSSGGINLGYSYDKRTGYAIRCIKN